MPPSKRRVNGKKHAELDPRLKRARAGRNPIGQDQHEPMEVDVVARPTASVARVPRVGARVRVFWPAVRKWYKGEIDRVAMQDGVSIFHVVYEDGDDRFWYGEDTRWELLDAAAAQPGAAMPPAPADAEMRNLDVVDHGEILVATSDAADLIGHGMLLPNGMWDGCEADENRCRCTIVAYSGEVGYVVRSRADECNYAFTPKVSLYQSELVSVLLLSTNKCAAAQSLCGSRSG